MKWDMSGSPHTSDKLAVQQPLLSGKLQMLSQKQSWWSRKYLLQYTSSGEKKKKATILYSSSIIQEIPIIGKKNCQYYLENDFFLIN